ncbi:MAG TPA: hypothetical protein VJU83_12880 [Burkholderiales bacterium]|nr:hypothetical protein [Burkholderiales bacterium]
MARLSSMNGADPTTPEELERILRALSDARVDDDPALADDFSALCRLLAAGQIPAPLDSARS